MNTKGKKEPSPHIPRRLGEQSKSFRTWKTREDIEKCQTHPNKQDLKLSTI